MTLIWCRLILMHGQLSLTMGLIMIAIILKIAHFLQEVSLVCNIKLKTNFKKMFYIYFFQDYFYGISIFLHYLFTSSLCCQLNMPAALCAELSWKYCQKEFKAFLISKCVTTIIKNSIRFSSSSSISCLFTTSKLDLGLLKSKTNINA